MFHFMQDATIDVHNGRVQNCHFTTVGHQLQQRHIEHKLQQLQEFLIGIYASQTTCKYIFAQVGPILWMIQLQERL